MSGLLSFLLRSGAGILRESAEAYIGRALIRRAVQSLVGLILFYGALTIFALAALAFFYLLLYRWLSALLGDVNAAAILTGANLLLIVLIILGRAVFRRRPKQSLNSPLEGLARSMTDGLEAGEVDFETGLAIGKQIGRRIRKAAPEIALAAALLGVIIGLRPQILGGLRRRKRGETPEH